MIDLGMIEPALLRRLRHGVGKAIADFTLISPHDRICVGVSGGKDSLALVYLLSLMRRHAPIQYELVPVMIDMGFGLGDAEHTAQRFLEQCGLTLHVERTEHAEVIANRLRPHSSYCSFCARLKRGALYGACRKHACNVLALGHHQDDFIETLLLNQFFIGTIKAMAAKTVCDAGDITVIRPLVYLAEEKIAQAITETGTVTSGCCCPVSNRDQQRHKMKMLIKDLARDIPHIRDSLLAALGNIQPRHLLDRRLHPYDGEQT